MNQYIEELTGIEITRERSKQKNELLEKAEVQELRGLAGKLLWVSSNTRPDVAFDVCTVSN